MTSRACCVAHGMSRRKKERKRRTKWFGRIGLKLVDIQLESLVDWLLVKHSRPAVAKLVTRG
eukprot:1148931-Pelagomonas_calceolata.AAC.5